MENKKLIWIVFYGLSALGKTHWLETVQQLMKQNDVFCQLVSSDDCSKKVIDGIREKHPTYTADQAFEHSRKPAIRLFEDSIAKAVAKLKPGNNIIILDKVMNSDKFLANLSKTFGVQCSSRLVAVIPRSEGLFYYSRSFVPFSVLLVANVCHRILTRGEHQTVQGPDEKKLFLALSFVKLYKDIKCLTEKKEAAHIDEFLEVSFHKEHAQALEAIPADFTALLKDTLKQVWPFQGEVSVCAELVAYIKSPSFKPVAEVLGFGDTGQQEESVKKIIGMFQKM